MIAGVNRTHPLDMAGLERIVAEDEKQRYSFNEKKPLIRTNQGHSIPVDVELEEVEPPDTLYHGTGEKYTVSIEEQGLIPKSRLYVHLSSNEDTALKVGMRHGKPVMYLVKSGEMYKDGLPVYASCIITAFAFYKSGKEDYPNKRYYTNQIVFYYKNQSLKLYHNT